MTDSLPPLPAAPVWRFCPRCGGELAPRDHGAGERQTCFAHECGFVHWNNPIPVVAAVVELNGRVLLARNAAWAEGAWGLITGFLEPVEDPLEGVLREVAEETGLTGRVEKLLGVWPFQRKNELLIAYHVVAEGEVKLSEELVDYRLVEPARLRPWPAGTGHALALWMRERGHEPVYLERFGEDPGY
ncbi:NUDIX domain-containing protein [Derxia lacustris]|uniref:NUDIX domain-containing protein n=1 Tax=Derxia lacustris TaxID=764842 RepID=UPI000A176A82|nr:NUDIX domain-containing protein [Derxia lacustris]